MTGINVLSTGVSAKSKEEGFSISEKAQVSSDSALMEFAAILSGWVAQVSGQGQNSGNQSNEPAGKEANSGRNAILGLDGLQALIGTIQGYGNPGEVLTEEVQGVKDAGQGGLKFTELLERQAQAESGQIQSPKGLSGDLNGRSTLGAGMLDSVLAQIQNWQLEAAPSNPMGNIEEIYRAGIPTGQPLGKNSPQSELDLYKGVISELLKEMSGEIKENKTNPESLSASAQQKQVLAAQRMNSGLFTQFADKIPFQAENVINKIPSDATSQVDEVLLGKGLRQDVNQVKLKADANTNISTNTTMNMNSNTNNEAIMLFSQRGLVQADQQSTARLNMEQSGTPENNVGTRVSGQESLVNVVPQKQELTQLKPSTNEVVGSVLLSKQEGVLDKKALQEKGTSSQPFSLEETKAQESVIESVIEGAGILSHTKENVQLHTKVENKVDLPIWAQVAHDIHEKAFQARSHIRELDIQLHPAELGQIRLSLRWEDGQVHLRMTASESGTGQMLQSNLYELRDSLSQLGIQCGMLEMGLGNQQKDSREQQGQGASSQARDNHEESQETQSALEWDTMSGIGLLESKESRNRINVTA